MSIDVRASKFSAQYNSHIKEVTPEPRYRFTRRIYFIIYFVLYCTNCLTYNLSRDFNKGPNLLQYIVVYFFIGLPLIHMQISIGQYIQFGSLYIKYMSPIGHGIGYAFIISTTFRLILQALRGGDYLMYLLLSLQPNLPYRSCPPKLKDQCWDGPVCNKTSCLSKTVFTSGYCYWNYTFMETIPSEPSFTFPSARRIFTIIVIWITVTFVILYALRHIIKICIHLFLISLGIIGLIAVALVLHPESNFDGFESLYIITYDNSINFTYWTKALLDIIAVMGLATAGYILLGSYLEPTAPSGLLSLAGTLLSGVCLFTMTLILRKCIGILSQMSKSNRKVIVANKLEICSFTVIPTCLLYIAGSDKFWNIIFFISCFCVSTNLLIVFVRVIDTSFFDLHTNIFKYRKYGLMGYIIGCVLITIFAACPGLHISTLIIFDDIVMFYDLIVMFCFTFMVSWIYGVQRLCDDIHFGVGQQPAKFWKFWWNICPLFMGLCTIQKTIDVSAKTKEIKLPYFKLIFLLLLMSPIYGLIIYELIKHVKTHNVIGVFQPDPLWGPPNEFDRNMRTVFNPRKEIRSRRPIQTCRHKCLLGSHVLQKLIDEEDKNKIIPDIPLTEFPIQSIGSQYSAESIQNLHYQNDGSIEEYSPK